MEIYGKALKVSHKRIDLPLEELVYSIDQSMSPSADISVAVGLSVSGYFIPVLDAF